MTWPRPLPERLAANYYLAPPGMGPAEFADLAVAAGFHGIAWTVRALDETDAHELGRIAANRGLFVSTLNSAGYFLWDDPGRVREQEALNARLVEAAAVMGAGHLVVITGGLAHGHRPLNLARARIAEGLADLAAQAAARGVRLALEPIHPMDLLAKGCINAIPHALALARGLPDVDLAIDLFHSGWDPALWTVLHTDRERVGVVQVCNAVEPNADAKPVRDLPGTGMWNVRAFVRHLIENDYAGAVEFELFDHHRRGRPVATLLETAAAQLRGYCAG